MLASGMASRGSEVSHRIAHLKQLRRLVGTAECQGGRDRTCSRWQPKKERLLQDFSDSELSLESSDAAVCIITG